VAITLLKEAEQFGIFAFDEFNVLMLYPSFGILLSPIIAAAAMALSSLSVISNALRLRTVAID
jgi:cation transport ATPase